MDNEDNNDVIEPFIGSLGLGSLFSLDGIFDEMQQIIEKMVSAGIFSSSSFGSSFCCIIFVMIGIEVFKKSSGAGAMF